MLSNRNQILILVILYRVLLDLIYINIIGVDYAYDNFIIDVHFDQYIFSYLFLFLLLYFLPKGTFKLSHLIIQFLFLLIYIPLSSYYANTGFSTYWFLLFNLFWFVLVLFQKINLSFVLPNHPKIKSKRVFYSLLSVILGFIVFMMYKLDFTLNFNLLKVYEQRELYRSTNIPGSGYMVNWIGAILLPFCLLYSFHYLIKKKKIIFLLVSISLIVIFFALTGHKSFLFFAPMALGVYFLIKVGNVFRYMVIGILSLLLISTAAYYLLDFKLPLSLVARRSLFVPAQISTYYFEFFHENYIYLSNSVLSGVTDSQVVGQPPKIIADLYFRDNVESANNGIISDAYIQFGWIGIVVWSFLLSLILKIADSLVLNKNKLILWPFLLITFTSVINSAFFTSLLTHGILIALLLSYVYPRECLIIKKDVHE